MNRERQLKVLQAIVEDYVHSREPVGSKALIERHNMKVSSATVRNDMASLENEGVITAPHASAGRIPTNKGYRLFVDQIAAVRPLSTAQKDAIERFLDSADDVDQMMDRTVRLLSQLTHQVAVAQYPIISEPLVRHIDLVPLGAHQLLLIVVLSNAEVLQKQLKQVNISDADIPVLCRTVRASVLEKDSAVTPSVSHSLRAAYDTVMSAVEQLMRHHQVSRLAIAGTSYLVESTDDFSHSIAPILDALEEQVVVLRILDELQQDQRGFLVRIGSENEKELLNDTAVVASGYGQENVSKLGIVGPTRMDYSANLAAVRAVAKYLSRLM